MKPAHIPHGEYVEGEVLVKMKHGAAPNVRGLGVTAKSLRSGLHRVKLRRGLSVPDAIAALRGDPSVEYAEPNYILRALFTPNDPSFPGNDLSFPQQWNLPIVNAPAAWDVSTGSSEVVIAVLDTGIDYNHPDLRDNIWTNIDEFNGDPGVDDDGNGYIDDVRGWDFVTNDNDPMDDNLHGTFVASIAAAKGNNGQFMAGVAFNVKIMPLKVLDESGAGLSSSITEAINYARAKGAHIANCSFGMKGAVPQTISGAISNSPSVLFPCAAGNDGVNNDTSSSKLYPASLPLDNIISVAATTQTDALASFSNFGAVSVDLAAPGGNGLPNGGVPGIIPPAQFVFLDMFDTLDDWQVTGTWGLTGAAFTSPAYSLTDSPDANYEINSSTTATSNTIDLTGKEACALYFEMKIDTENTDILLVQASRDDGATWQTLKHFSGIRNTFISENDFISASLDGLDGQPVRIRFTLQTDFSGTRDGAYIDDVAVICPSTNYSSQTVHPMSGTSFSAPHVSGAAALLKSEFPSLTALEIKSLLLGSVDVLPSLQGKVATNGRLNIHKSFFPPAPEGFSGAAANGTNVNLWWQDVPNETGYVLERRTGSTAYSTLPTLGQNVTSYSDTGLTPDTTYFYRLRAVNDIGESAQVEITVNSIPGSNGTPPTGGGGGGGGGGGCFIATAAFGSPLAREVTVLREFRDRVLMKSAPGREFAKAYYRYSPWAARHIAENRVLKLGARAALYPVVYAVKFPWLFAFVLAAPFAPLAFKIVKYRMKTAGNRNGFTLLEILVVVFILGILASIVAPKIMGRTDDARVTEAKVQIKNIETALKMYKLDTGGYPSTEQGLQALITKPTTGKVPERYREGGYLEQTRVPADPWGNEYVYLSPGLNGDYDLLSLGADGKEGGDSYDADIRSWELE